MTKIKLSTMIDKESILEVDKIIAMVVKMAVCNMKSGKADVVARTPVICYSILLTQFLRNWLLSSGHSWYMEQFPDICWYVPFCH